MTSNLTSRIKSYLDRNSSRWISTQLIYTLARKNGYLYKDIRAALSEIARTPPYATWSVSAGDRHAMKEPDVTGSGMYYRRHNIPPNDLKQIRAAIDAFEAM